MMNQLESFSEIADCNWPSMAQEICYKRYIKTSTLQISEWLNGISNKICAPYNDSYQRLKWSQLYFKMLAKREFLPTSAALTNAYYGEGSLAGCIVLPIPTEIDEIVTDFIPKAHTVLRNGIGVGVDLSCLAPRLCECCTSGRAYPGPCQIIRAIVSAVGPLIEYSGMKRAAFMGSLRATHPDIFEFIYLKSTYHLSEINVSVAIDRDFKDALDTQDFIKTSWGLQNRPLTVQELKQFEERAKRRSVSSPDLFVLDNGDVRSRCADEIVGLVKENIIYLSASKILDHISMASHRHAEPGLLDLENINKANPTMTDSKLSGPSEGCGEITTTTPCGEQPLLPYEVCHLGSINLIPLLNGMNFDYRRLRQLVSLATRFMDDLIEVSNSDLPEATRVSKLNRKIGIGMMGLADALAILEIPYGSPAAQDFAANLMKIINETAIHASVELAKERGPFPNWERSVYYMNGQLPRRNATVTTIAPTGHISMIAGCNSGIEPFYLLQYSHQAGGSRIRNAYGAQELLKRYGYSLEEWSQISSCNITILKDNAEQLKKLRHILETAHEVNPLSHVQLISRMQPHVENGISKTINLPAASTFDDVKSIFKAALSSGLKGITVYRDGCHDKQVNKPVLTTRECQNCQL